VKYSVRGKSTDLKGDTRVLLPYPPTPPSTPFYSQPLLSPSLPCSPLSRPLGFDPTTTVTVFAAFGPKQPTTSSQHELVSSSLHGRSSEEDHAAGLMHFPKVSEQASYELLATAVDG